ncbi:MAG: two-component regulator propeller domain-containing protein [Terracidiphilus sp.]
MSRAYATAAVWLGILFAGCACAPALDPSLDISQYAHTSWKTRDGFVKGAITALAQSPDGYLWLGTDFGLLRFDGVRAVPWRPPAGEKLPSNSIVSLLQSRDGTLWIGTRQGLARWKDGKIATYPDLAGRQVFRLLEDREGAIWAGAIQPPNDGRLCEIRSEKATCFGGDGSLGAGVASLYEDSKGSLWVGVFNGFWRWKPGPPKFFPIPGENNAVRAIIEDSQGALLIVLHDGIKRLVSERLRPYSVPGLALHSWTNSILRDHDGGLWLGTYDRGLIHIHDGMADSFSEGDGFSGTTVSQILEDHEGNTWAGTLKGLDRFRPYSISSLSLKQGLAGTPWSVLAANDGSILIGSTAGLSRWEAEKMLLVDPVSFKGAPPDSLFQDRNGRLWIATGQQLGYLKDGKFAPLSGYAPGYVHGLVEDRAGDLWIANQQAGLFHLKQGALELAPWSALGRKDFAMSLIADPSRSGLWLGFLLGGVAYYEEGRVRASYSTADGLGEGLVNDLRFGPRGALWAATGSGLSRIKDGRIATLTSKNGLPCDTVHWSMEDDDHATWLYTACGLVRIARSEMDAWVADPRKTVHTTIFDESDGVRINSIGGGYKPLAAKTHDGRIWFITFEGVSVIDPQNLHENKLPPPVHIEQIVADDKPYVATPNMRLPQHVHYLGIDYTALSLVVPEKVRFRVKLEGEDKDWRELVNVRHVEYTNLPPRHYRFRVLACNNSGVWNETGDSLDFTIPPSWYQTLWFRAACVAAFLLLLWAIYRRRVQELQAQEKKFREAVETMPALAFVSDPSGNRPFVNRGWLDYTGMSAEQASGSGWQKAIHPDDLKRVLDKWQTAQATAEPLAYETRMRRGSDGAWRWFQTRARPLFDRRGKVVKWCAVATDIEDRKRAEQLQADLAHVNRVSTLGELAASISHELNQPIAVAIMNADLSLHCLHRDPPDLTQIQERTTRIIEMNTLASEIIDRLRSLYKKEPPKRVVLAVNEVIGEMAELLRGQAMRHGASLRTELADDLPNVIADRVQLQQVLMNLMLNGIEAMGETGGVLTVKSDIRPDGQIEISVNDNGPGLPPGKADQIFDAFFTTKPQGSGMGLAISKSIVESHGGQIWADGDAEHGATFHFTLPPAPVEAEIPVAAM